MKYPTYEQVVELNRRILESSCSHFAKENNVQNPGSLNYALELIQTENSKAFLSIKSKIAKLSWAIIRGHIFWDGNKRTGISTMEAFAKMNGYKVDATDDELFDIAMSIATGSEYSYEDFVSWVEEYVIRK